MDVLRFRDETLQRLLRESYPGRSLASVEARALQITGPDPTWLVAETLTAKEMLRLTLRGPRALKQRVDALKELIGALEEFAAFCADANNKGEVWW